MQVIETKRFVLLILAAISILLILDAIIHIPIMNVNITGKILGLQRMSIPNNKDNIPLNSPLNGT